MNAFDMIAEGQIAAPVKAKQRASEKRASSALLKKQKERNELGRLYRVNRDKEHAALLAGPHGQDIRGLIAFLDAMTLSSAPALVRMIDKAAWLQHADKDTRFQVLRLVDAGIVRLREQNGLTPFEDSLIDEPPTAFEQIREVLR